MVGNKGGSKSSKIAALIPDDRTLEEFYVDCVRIGAALRGGGELVQRIKTSVLENLSYDKNGT